MQSGTDVIVHRISVTHNGRSVGEISFAPEQDRWSFRYDHDWVRQGLFQLSPAFPWNAPEGGYDSNAIRRFIVNLFPEGAPLRAAIEQLHVAPSNAFALLRGMGGETTGALEFHAADHPQAPQRPQRLLPRTELNERILAARDGGLTVWDGRVRMSIAGYQDKVAVYCERDPADGPEVDMWLAEPPMASTYILKPQPMTDRTPHLVVNEHFCMSLAALYADSVAPVSIMRLPTPVLVVKRFDRQLRLDTPDRSLVKRHVIDACQASDIPADYKYERNLGNAPELLGHRDGMSMIKLFSLANHMLQPAAARLELLRWALFQLIIGNSDAHGKNFSFFAQRAHLQPAPWYDVVCVARYPDLDQSFAMAIGDAFSWDDLTPMELAYFGHQCKVDSKLLLRECMRLTKLVGELPRLLANPIYTDEERDFLAPITDLVRERTGALVDLASAARAFKAEHF